MKLDEIILRAVRDSLERNKGNRKLSAKDLGICVRTLRNWLNNPAKYKKKKAYHGIGQEN